MGTSNWQNIPFCIESLMKIAPHRVLDIGVGFGRWGMIVREFCDVWFQRVLPDQWNVHIEGIEGFANNIAPYHAHFYNHIHIGDAREVLPTLSADWDVIIFGDVLEHFTRDEAERMLNWGLSHAKYLMINIPLGTDWPQVDMYDNPYERHLSEWGAADFQAFSLRRQALFNDYLGRPFGSFILSREDPHHLADSLFSQNTASTSPFAARFLGSVEPLEQQLFDQVRTLQSEVTMLRERLYEYEPATDERAASPLSLMTADRDRLWVEVQQWHHEYKQTETALQKMSVDRNRWWTEGHQWHDEHAHLQAKLTAQQQQGQVAQQELRRIQQSRVVRRIDQIKRSFPYRAARYTVRRVRTATRLARTAMYYLGVSKTIPVSIRATGAHHPESNGSEVWLLDIVTKQGEHIQPWKTIARAAGWQLTTSEQSRQTQAMVAVDPATLHLNVRPDTLLRVLRHPWSGVVDIKANGHLQSIDLFAPHKDVVTIQLGSRIITQEHTTKSTFHQGSSGPERWSQAEHQWIRNIQTHTPAAIAVMHPEWRGVRSCMENLLSHSLLLEDDLDDSKAQHVARMIAESGCERVMFGGFPLTYTHLVHALNRLAPNIKIYPFWLGTFLQSNEDYAWQGFKHIAQLCREQRVTKWGFAKHGMAEVVERTGVPTGFVMSYVRSLPEGPSLPLEGGPHLGLWAIEPIWRKSPYAMLAATSLIEHAHVVGRGQNERVHDFARFLNIKATLHDNPLPREAMPAALAQMHLNLYVTLSECTPMLPLESLAAGAPCLIGPTSHLFEDHPYLHSRLVVPSPDRAFVIAQYIEQALAERDQIVLAYKDYAPGYNARAQASLRAFLEVADDAVL